MSDMNYFFMVENGNKNFFLLGKHKQGKNYPIQIYSMNFKLTNKKNKQIDKWEFHKVALLDHCNPLVKLECEILVFAEGGKHRTPGKTLRARMRTDDKLNIHVTMVAELNPDHNGGR